MWTFACLALREKRNFSIAAFFTLVAIAFAIPPGAKCQTKSQASQDWPVYGGQAAGDHYSALDQINRSNVQALRVTWKFDSGEDGGLETSPIIVGRVLYTYTPRQEVIALDAASGKLLWKFDSGINGTQPARGLAYWTDGKERRILAGVMNFLYALDASTGKPIPGFGEDGRVDLRKGLGRDYEKQSIALTSPGIVYKDLIIVGGRNPEEHPAPPGDIRAYDVRSGALRWSFHTIPRPGEYGYDTWPKDAWKNAGSANNWAGMTLDSERGIVYVPTGSAVFDFYGGDRVGNDLFANSLLALNAETGKRIWHFQGVHHDIWDRDFPSPPALVRLHRNGRRVDAIAQTTKQGFLYVFDRSTGEPLFPVVESKYPPSTVPGEVTSPTQPLPVAPAPYSRQRLTEEMLTNRTPEAHAWAVKRFQTVKSDGQFIPFSLDKLTVVFPGFDGGAEWGGPAVDPTTGVIYINANDIPWFGGLTVPRPPGSAGERIYQNQCSICHGADRSGSPPSFPSLVDVGDRLTDQEIETTIHQGRGRMPAFGDLNDQQIKELVGYLKSKGSSSGDTSPGVAAETAEDLEARKRDMPYQFTGYKKFLDPDGYPAVVPPWGTLNAIDMNTGKYLWKIPLGEYPELAAKGMGGTGSENYGGPIVTGGGLLFIGATAFDRMFRAFDSHTGKLLWQDRLPFSGMDTPATYMVDGKQYVVIGAGGGKETPKQRGGMYVAYALP
ncbi:MAG TPA: pyrroloquinoline quinone-dependent dehydrogenase [Acidobacteriaceae bacterium]|nr:pyrroloquinoline quinone-dependent dehydrogenase [Acidobacteriaceae bacterium]